MHTLKLRAYQQPSRVERRIDRLVVGHQWVPSAAEPVRARGEMPAALQQVALKAEAAQCSWRAWPSFDGYRLFVGEMSLASSRERGRPVLEVRFYNEQGELQESGLWTELADGAWQPCTS